MVSSGLLTKGLARMSEGGKGRHTRLTVRLYPLKCIVILGRKVFLSCVVPANSPARIPQWCGRRRDQSAAIVCASSDCSSSSAWASRADPFPPSPRPSSLRAVRAGEEAGCCTSNWPGGYGSVDARRMRRQTLFHKAASFRMRPAELAGPASVASAKIPFLSFTGERMRSSRSQRTTRKTSDLRAPRWKASPVQTGGIPRLTTSEKNFPSVLYLQTSSYRRLSLREQLLHVGTCLRRVHHFNKTCFPSCIMQAVH
jgi:hypothetical protein